MNDDSQAEQSVRDAKAALRAAMRTRRGALSADWVEAHSAPLQDRLLALPEFKGAGRVALYLAGGGEVLTDRVLAACRREGKAVYVPAFDVRRRGYGFAVFAQGQALERGPLAIAQPRQAEFVAAAELDFVVVPGLAFDPRGGRIGQGGGHYDAMLAGAERPFRAGAAYEFQIVEAVPRFARDVDMHAVITEERIIRAARG